MTINLESFKKKNARNFCLGVSAAAKYVAAEHTCKLGLQTRYFYNSGKIFDNPSWNISHGICLDKSIKYLEETFKGINPEYLIVVVPDGLRVGKNKKAYLTNSYRKVLENAFYLSLENNFRILLLCINLNIIYIIYIMAAEQIQISYINTTSSGINMIASWIKLNHTENNFEKINYLTKYNSNPNIFISLKQYNVFFPTISLIFLGFTSISSLIIFYFCNLCYSKKNNYLNVTDTTYDNEKALNTTDNIDNIGGSIKRRKTLFKLFKAYNYFGFFICLLTGFIDINYNHISYALNGESVKYCLNNNCTIHLAEIKTLNTQKINRNLYHAEMNNLLHNQKLRLVQKVEA